jgi:hypothetical protein
MFVCLHANSRVVGSVTHLIPGKCFSVKALTEPTVLWMGMFRSIPDHSGGLDIVHDYGCIT